MHHKLPGLFFALSAMVFVSFSYAGCPDITGVWDVTFDVVVNQNGTITYQSFAPASFPISNQNDCRFDGSFVSGPIVGAIVPISANKRYAVTIQGLAGPGIEPFLIQGILKCKKPDGAPIVCKTMEASLESYQGDSNNYLSEIGVLSMKKQ